jgi:hypothetical protein
VMINAKIGDRQVIGALDSTGDALQRIGTSSLVLSPKAPNRRRMARQLD